jgi:ABC-2 type transport system permease protein
MRKVGALMRASWLEATSYRMRTAFSILSMFAAMLPVYYVARAVQPMVGDAVEHEGASYFAFIVVGLTVLPFVRTSLSALSGELGSAISTGTLEALLGTPTRIATLLVGMVGYPFLWAAIRSAVVLSLGAAMGVHLVWDRALVAVAALVLIVLAHTAAGLVGAAMVVAFRTSGPLETIILWTSSMLGGLYFPTQVIPTWLEQLSLILPLTYGLRAFRRALLEPDASWALLAPDLLVLAAGGVVGLAIGLCAFSAALRYARRAGTLAQY